MCQTSVICSHTLERRSIIGSSVWNHAELPWPLLKGDLTGKVPDRSLKPERQEERTQYRKIHNLQILKYSDDDKRRNVKLMRPDNVRVMGTFVLPALSVSRLRNEKSTIINLNTPV